MKKNFLAIMAVLLTIPFISKAQNLPLTAGSGYPLSGLLVTNVYGTNQFALNNNGSNYGFILNPSTGKWSLGYGSSLSTTGTSVLTWDDSGKVGIGTTSPNGRLEVNTPATYLDPMPAFAAAVNDQSSSSSTLVVSNGGAVSRAAGISFYATPSTDGRLFNTGNIKGGWTGSGYSSTYVTLGSAASGASYNDELTLTGGKVGIGTASPTLANLVVYGNQGIAIDGNNAASQLNFYNSGAVLGSIGKGNYAVTSADQTGISMYSEGAMSFAAGGQSEKMRIASNGKVGIGTDTPDQLLSVNGTIHAKEVLVDLTGWSDYVLKPAYKLPALSAVKTYIDQNHHLPEVPSEEEIVKNGLKMGEMNKLLMKKVEELTLYLIEQNTAIETQQRQLNRLKQQLKNKRQ